MKEGDLASDETNDSPPISGIVLARGIISNAITTRAAINGNGSRIPCLSWAIRYPIMATNPEIDSHKIELAIGSSSDSTLNRIMPVISQLFPTVPVSSTSIVFKQITRILSPSGSGLTPVQTIDSLPKLSSREYFSVVGLNESTRNSSS